MKCITLPKAATFVPRLVIPLFPVNKPAPAIAAPTTNLFFPCLNYMIEKILISVGQNPSITDGVHRKENFVEIIPVFSTFSNFFKKKKKKNYKSHFM